MRLFGFSFANYSVPLRRRVVRKLFFLVAVVSLSVYAQAELQTETNDTTLTSMSTPTISRAESTSPLIHVICPSAGNTTNIPVTSTSKASTTRTITPPAIVPACSSLYLPEATDCAGKALYSKYSTCASDYSFYQYSDTPWFLNNIYMPYQVAYLWQLALPPCLQEPNVSAIIVSGYCTSSMTNWGLGNAYLWFIGFSVRASSNVIQSVYAVFYWPFAVYILYATITVLHEIRKANPDNHIIFFFHALSVAQFAGYFFYIYGFILIILVFFFPFCFVSPTFALNSFTIANAVTSQQNMYFPTVYIWCYQALLLACIGFDRVVAIYFPVRYSYTFDKAFTKKCLRILTIGFTLVSVIFVTGVVVGAYWGQTVYTGSSTSASTKLETLCLLVFCLIFLVLPTTLYIGFAIAIVVSQCLRCRRGAGDDVVALNASAEARRKVAALQLSTLALTPVLLNLAVVFFEVCSTIYWFIEVTFAGQPAAAVFRTLFLTSGMKGYFPYVLDLSFVVAFILQCIFSKLFRKGAKQFAKKTWLGGLLVMPLMRRFWRPVYVTGVGSSIGASRTRNARSETNRK